MSSSNESDSSESSSSSKSNDKKKCRKCKDRKHDSKKDCSKKDRTYNNKDKRISHNVRREFKHMLSDYCLMLSGSDAYGSFYSTDPQVVIIDAPFLFQYNQNVLNIEHKTGTSDVVVKRDGVYKVEAVVQTDQASQLAFFVDGVVDQSTITASNSAAGFIVINQVLKLKKSSILTLRNHTSLLQLTTSLTSSGTSLPSTNISLTIFKIAPYPLARCLPPEPDCKDQQ